MDKYFSGKLTYQSKNCKKVTIGIASPDLIKFWSYGEVTRSETINYRTLKPEKRGLFCAQIFGPIVDNSCLCEKYQKAKYKGTICEKCGVEVASSRVRRERIGHISLHYPVVHTWYLKYGIISSLLSINNKKLESILNFESEVITNYQEIENFKGDYILVNEDQKLKAIYTYGDKIKIDSGASAVKSLLSSLDLKKMMLDISQEISETSSVLKSQTLSKKLGYIEGMITSKTNPSWMIFDILPVLPCDLRPIMQLQGGRFASSDVNNTYKSIINRNNRLKKLLYLRAPDVIIKNERRMLQDAVNNLFKDGVDYQKSGGTIKALGSQIKGKFGRFRMNLLGKRVDYSGRSVIAAGPGLELDECGIPVQMCIELFKPFIYRELYNLENLSTIGQAKTLIEDRHPIVYDIIHKLTAKSFVVLNRAPTLHKFSMLAFKPKVTSGKAINIHPLVCKPFNADFDGDTMAVHLPLSTKSQQEAEELLLSKNNVLHPNNGEYVMEPSQDMILGLYFASLMNNTKHVKCFRSKLEVERAYQNHLVKMHDQVRVIINGVITNTSVGRILISRILLHPELNFSLVNRIVNLSVCREIFDNCLLLGGRELLAETLNNISKVSLQLASMSGIGVGMEDLVQVGTYKEDLVREGLKSAKELSEQKDIGILNKEEHHVKVITLWNDVNNQLTKHIQNTIIDAKVDDPAVMNALILILVSGSRGSINQVKQILGMRGLMSKTNNEIIEFPVISNFVEGIKSLEYFISAHGSRKGLADKALSTADTGYLTRKVTVATDDVLVTKEDCGTREGIVIKTLYLRNGKKSLSARICGRILVNDFSYKDLFIPAGVCLTLKQAKQIESVTDQITIRSPIKCKTINNCICQKCYGIDLSTQNLVAKGSAVGIIASQCIGEPATQLTLRLFHTGGIYSSGGQVDLSYIHSPCIGVAHFKDLDIVTNRQGDTINLNYYAYVEIVNHDLNKTQEKIHIPYGAQVMIKDRQEIKAGDIIASARNKNILLSPVSGKMKIAYTKSMVQFSPIDNTYKAIHFEPKLAPVITITKGGKNLFTQSIPAGYVFTQRESVCAGDTLYAGPTSLHSSQQSDIVGGLSNLINVLEMRNSAFYATLNKFNGTITELNYTKNHIKIFVTSDDRENVTKAYDIPNATATHNFFLGQKLKAGEQLTIGDINLNDLIQYIGADKTLEFLLDSLNTLMSDYNVHINDKHYEVIVKKMASKVIVVSKNSTKFFYNQSYEKQDIDQHNINLKEEDQVKYKRVLTSIVKLGINCKSFLSAAAFQDTTKVLTKASIAGKDDMLYSLKENIIAGNPIPCGSNFKEN